MTDLLVVDQQKQVIPSVDDIDAIASATANVPQSTYTASACGCDDCDIGD